MKQKIAAILFIFLSAGLFAQNAGQGNAAWKLNGNTPTEGNFIGSVNYMPLIFKTNDIERMRITEDGAVEMEGGLKVDSIEANTPGGNISFLSKSVFDKDVSIALNLGLGVLDPTERLDVNGNMKLSGNSTIGGDTDIAGNLSTAGNAVITGDIQTFSGVIFPDGRKQTEAVIFDNGLAKLERLSIGGIGSNGGTTALVPQGAHAGYALSVYGKAVVRHLVVTTDSWADFVFDKAYSLDNLEEVESYISEHGHLPNVPSEKEVIENGIDMAEMDAILLRKIEELTLYMIEINEANKQLKIEVSRLRNN